MSVLRIANGSFSIIFSSDPRPGHVKSRYGANGVHESIGAGQTGYFSVISSHSLKLGKLKSRHT